MKLFLVDTNVWISTRMLRSAAAAPFLAYLHATQAKVLFCDVLEAEIRRNVGLAIADDLQRAQKALRAAHSFLSIETDPEIVCPGPDQIIRDISKRLAELSPYFQREPFDPESCRRALQRVIDRVPPASDGAQFKDSLLYETLVASDVVAERVIISSDRAFFDGAAVHPELGRQGTVAAYPDFASFMRTTNFYVRDPVDDVVREKVVTAVHKFVFEDAAEQGIHLEENDLSLASVNLRSFLTDVPGRVTIDFDVAFPALAVTGDDREGFDAFFRTLGSCLFAHDGGVVSGVAVDRSILSTPDEDIVADVSWRDGRVRPIHRFRRPRFEGPWVTQDGD